MMRMPLVAAGVAALSLLPAIAEPQSQQPTAGRWALIVGSDRWPEIVAAQRATSTALRERYGYAAANVIEAYGRDATHAGIRRLLRDLGTQVRPADSIFVYAMLPPTDRTDGDYFLAADGQPGEVWTLIGRDEFEEAVGSLPTSSSLLVINGCTEAPRASWGRASTMQTQAVLKGGTGRGSMLSFCDSSAPDRGARRFAEALAVTLQSPADAKDRLSDTDLDAQLRARLAGMSVTLHRASPRAGGFEFVVDRLHADALLRQLRTSTTPQAQAQAIEALSTLLRSTPDEAMRAAVMGELSQVGRDPTFEALPRLRAIGALGETGLPAAVAELGVIAARDPEPEFRRAALAALARIATPEAVRSLLAALKDPDATVRAAAVRGAGTHPQLASAAPIVAAIGDGSPDVQVTALQVVSVLARPQLGRNLMNPHLGQARRAAQRALSSPSPDVRREAVNALALLGVDLARRDVPALELLTKDGDVSVRKTVALTLGREFRGVWDDPDSSGGDRLKLNELRQPALTALIRVADPSPSASAPAPADVRAAAMWSLGEIGDARGQPVLMRALDDPDAAIREAAMEALGKMRHQPAMPVIARGLSEASPRIRATAARALGLMRAPGASGPLLALLATETDVYVRAAVEEALRQLPPPSMENVAAALASESPKVRFEAVEGLDKVQDPAAAQLAIDALADVDFDVRKGALEVLVERAADWFPAISDPSIAAKPSAVRFGTAVVLGRIGTPAAGTALLQRLETEQNPAVKAAVVTAMSSVPPTGEIEAALLRVVQEADPSLKAAAASAFVNYSSPAVRQALETLAEDEEPEVRERAIATLRKIAK